MIALALALVCLQAPPSPSGMPAQSAVERALARDPSTLARAEVGRWLAWRPAEPVPAPIRDTFTAAARAYQDADYGAALEQLYATLEREPEFPAALYQLGSTYFRLRRYGDCARALERFVSVVPGEVGATQALAHSYYTLGEYEHAEAHYRKVLAASPKSVEAWRGLGIVLFKRGASSAALECLDKSLSLRPQHADALVWRAQVLVALERPAEALDAAQRGRDLAPFEPRAWFVLAQILDDSGRSEDAAAARTRFAELNRIEQDIRSQEGLLLHNPQAIASLLKLVQLQRAARNHDEARAALARVLRVAPDDLAARVLALETAADFADTVAAAAAVEVLEQKFAEHVAAWIALERYFRASGATARADAAAAKAVALDSKSK